MEQHLDCTNIGTYVHDNDDKIYRFLVLKKIFTPYEQEHKFMDESIYEGGSHYNFCKLGEVIETTGDTLIELVIYTQEDEGVFEYAGYSEFYLLSDIRLSLHDSDNELHDSANGGIC